MWGRRLTYLAALSGCLVFYAAYQEWLGWLLLVGMLALPWVSLVLSLPALLTARLQVRCPSVVNVGDEALPQLFESGPLPQAPIKLRLELTDCLTGSHTRQKPEQPLPTEHCGAWQVQPVKVRRFDYLLLFRLPLGKKEGARLLVRPLPIPMETPPSLDKYLELAFRPKPGGGFAENHELRLYRPGDDLRQIHWKLSAKTGELVLREPQEPVRGLAVVALVLSGEREKLDEKLGQLLWLSDYLIQRQVPHQIRCLTGRGMESFAVDAETDILPAVDSLLQSPMAQEGSTLPPIQASWLYEIGGVTYA